MDKLNELSYSEMKNISGGTNLAYEVGYIVGRTVRHFLDFIDLYEGYKYIRSPH